MLYIMPGTENNWEDKSLKEIAIVFTALVTV